MKTYRMTAAETMAWESEDARERDAARAEIRANARAKAFASDEMHELVSEDGVVMDVVYPSTTDEDVLISGLERHQEAVGQWLEQDAE